jgi:hypothetical protein
MQSAVMRWIGLECAQRCYAIPMSMVEGVSVRNEFRQAMSHDGWPVWVHVLGGNQTAYEGSGWVVVLKNAPGKASIGLWAQRVIGPFSAQLPESEHASENLTIHHAGQAWSVLPQRPEGEHGVFGAG